MFPFPRRFGLGLAALLFAAAPAFSVPGRTALPRSVTLSEGWLFQPDPLGIGDVQKRQKHPDYRHRNGFTNEFPTYFGPFGIVTLDRHPKKAHAALRALWTNGASGR